MKTVWSKDSMPLVAPRFRSIFTVILPVADVGLILFGFTSLTVGSKIVSAFTLPWFPAAWGAVVLAGAVGAFAGLAFLWKRFELIARGTLAIGLLIYVYSISAYIVAGNSTSTLTLILVLIRLSAVGWRINDLIADIGREEADKEARTGGVRAQ